MKIVVIGGSGVVGTKLVNKLRLRGHHVANSPSYEDDAAMKFFDRAIGKLTLPEWLRRPKEKR